MRRIPLPAALLLAACAEQPVSPPADRGQSAAPVATTTPASAVVALDPAQARAFSDAIQSAVRYPEQSLASNEHGITRLLIRIDRSGRVLSCTLDSGSGSTPLDQAALQACSTARLPAPAATLAPGAASIEFLQPVYFEASAGKPAPLPPPEQIATERKLLLKEFGLAIQSLRSKQDSLYASWKLPRDSVSGQFLVQQILGLLADPAFQARFVDEASDAEIAQAFDERNGGEHLGRLVGKRLFGRGLRSLPDERQVQIFRTYVDVYEAATPQECPGLLGNSNGVLFRVLDRLPPADRQIQLGGIIDGVRITSERPKLELTLEQRRRLNFAVQRYLAALPEAQLKRVQDGISDKASPDHCWAISQSMRGMLSAEPDVQALAARAIFSGISTTP